MTNPNFSDSQYSDSPYGNSAGYGSQQPSYGAQGAGGFTAASTPAAQCPPSNVGWAVASILFFWPLSFVAMSRALDVYPLWASGRHAEAQAASATAKKFGMISLALVAAIFVLYIVFIIIMVSVASTAGSYY